MFLNSIKGRLEKQPLIISINLQFQILQIHSVFFYVRKVINFQRRRIRYFNDEIY